MSCWRLAFDFARCTIFSGLNSESKRSDQGTKQQINPIESEVILEEKPPPKLLSWKEARQKFIRIVVYVGSDAGRGGKRSVAFNAMFPMPDTMPQVGLSWDIPVCNADGKIQYCNADCFNIQSNEGMKDPFRTFFFAAGNDDRFEMFVEACKCNPQIWHAAKEAIAFPPEFPGPRH